MFSSGDVLTISPVLQLMTTLTMMITLMREWKAWPSVKVDSRKLKVFLLGGVFESVPTSDRILLQIQMSPLMITKTAFSMELKALPSLQLLQKMSFWKLKVENGSS